MTTYTRKPQPLRKQSAPNTVVQNKANKDRAFHLIDNRPEASLQKRHKEMAANPSQAPTPHLHEMASNRSARQRSRHTAHALDSNKGLPVAQRRIAISYGNETGLYGPDKIREFLDLIQPVYDQQFQSVSVKRSILDLIKSHNIYRFSTAYNIFDYMTKDEEDRSSFEEELQIHPDDMKKTGPMPESYSESKGCVVQAIAQMVGNTPQFWHDYFIKKKKIDYTEAMNHLKVLSDEKVGLKLIHNENTTWGDLNATLGNGKFVFINMINPGAEGHAFAVTKNGDGDYDIHDKPQQVIKKYNTALRIQYVFK